MKMGYGAILANEHVIRLGTFTNISQNLNLCVLGRAKMMKKPFQEISRISKTAAMSTRAARMSTRSSKDEHEKQQG